MWHKKKKKRLLRFSSNTFHTLHMFYKYPALPPSHLGNPNATTHEGWEILMEVHGMSSLDVVQNCSTLLWIGWICQKWRKQDNRYDNRITDTISAFFRLASAVDRLNVHCSTIQAPTIHLHLGHAAALLGYAYKRNMPQKKRDAIWDPIWDQLDIENLFISSFDIIKSSIF